MAGALIITAELAAPDFAWLQAERRRHYPPERNRVPAHLTLFRSLPPSAEPEVRRQLARVAAAAAPKAMVAGILLLDRGVAYRVASDDLHRLRLDLAASFHGLLGETPLGGWAPHVTIQNGVAAGEARSLAARLRRDFAPRPLQIRGLAVHRHCDGRWAPVALYPFRG